MRKTIFPVIAFVCCMLFTGCAPSQKADTPVEDEIQFIEDNIYKTDMLSPRYCVYDDKSAYVFDDNGDGSYSIKYVDFENKLITHLCNQPSCEHNTDACTAYVPPFIGGSYLAKTPDCLVLLTVGNTIDIPPSVITMSHNGSGRKTLVEFDMAQRITAPYVLGEKSIYIIVTTTFEDADKSLKTKKELIKVDLLTGKLKVISEIPESYELIGVKDNKFLFREYADKEFILRLLSQKGGEMAELFRYTAGKGIATQIDNKIYYFNYEINSLQLFENNCLTDVVKLPFEGSTLNTHLRAVNSNMLIIDNSQLNPVSGWYDDIRYCIDLNNGNYTTNAFILDKNGKENNMRVYAFTDKYVLAEVDFKNVDHVGEVAQTGEKFTYQTAEAIYGIFSTEDYINNNLKYDLVEEI